jgi:hypothetical protein
MTENPSINANTVHRTGKIIKQVGGSHYEMPIQPWEFIVKNELPWAEGEIVKYVTRWKNKNGIEDLQKARSIIDFLIDEVTRQEPVDDA